MRRRFRARQAAWPCCRRAGAVARMRCGDQSASSLLPTSTSLSTVIGAALPWWWKKIRRRTERFELVKHVGVVLVHVGGGQPDAAEQPCQRGAEVRRVALLGCVGCRAVRDDPVARTSTAGNGTSRRLLWRHRTVPAASCHAPASRAGRPPSPRARRRRDAYVCVPPCCSAW